MTPSLCARCGAALPDPMVPAVVTCPGCGAKSEARTSAPGSESGPTDLVAARDLARRLDVYDMPGMAEQMRAMANEIARLRAEVATAHAAGVAEERTRWVEGMSIMRWYLRVQRDQSVDNDGDGTEREIGHHCGRVVAFGKAVSDLEEVIARIVKT